MSCNVGGVDRAFRIIIGVTLICLTAYNVLPVWGWIGVIPLFTALIGWCPAYLPFGIRTCRKA
ncbi:MAG: DUF2892 domain-containing protein [Rhodospirillaceae bacterium]